jgi:hypothetical protein
MRRGRLADLLRTGMLRPVYHGEHGLRTLRELARSYQTISQDLNRVMNRLKALYRGWGVACAGTQVYAPRNRQEWLSKLEHAGVRRRAELLYHQLDGLQALRRTLRPELLAESGKHKAAKLLRQIPCIGPIRAARLIALMQTPRPSPAPSRQPGVRIFPAAPPISLAPSHVVGKEIPRHTVWTVVLPNGSPGAFANIRTPMPPEERFSLRFREAATFLGVRYGQCSCSSQRDVVLGCRLQRRQNFGSGIQGVPPSRNIEFGCCVNTQPMVLGAELAMPVVVQSSY